MIATETYLRELKSLIESAHKEFLNRKMNLQSITSVKNKLKINDIHLYLYIRNDTLILNLANDFSVNIDETSLMKLDDLYEFLLKHFEMNYYSMKEAVLLRLLTSFYTGLK